MKKWLSAFLTSISITIGTFVLLSISANLSEGSIIGKVIGYLGFIPYIPIGLILNVLFRGPDHSGIVFGVAIVLMFFFYTITTWLVLGVLDFKRRRASSR
jgi:hypothetical protein